LTPAIRGGFANFNAKRQGVVRQGTGMRHPISGTWRQDPSISPGKRPIRARDQIFQTIQRPVAASQPMTSWSSA